MNKPARFTIRVYGLLTDHNGRLLMVHEKIGDFAFTKFPGGGLEFGEGLKECLTREFMEETGIRVEITDHVYTTDFFQPSAFSKTDQLIAIYYRVKALDDTDSIPLHEFEVEGNGSRPETLRFFWVPENELHEGMLTFPVDKWVSRLLKNDI